MNNYGEIQQELLIIRLADGDNAAFDELYHLYSKAVYLRLRFLVKDADVADELLQELFMRVWTHRANLDPQKSFRAYLFTIAQNLVYNYFRKLASDQALIRNLILNQVDYYLSGDELFENKEAGQLLQKAIDQLSPQRRQVFQLCKLEGKSYEETGKIMGISIATVNSHMTQSLQSIRSYLLKHQDIALILISFTGLSSLLD